MSYKLLQLIVSFLQVGLFSIGGGYATIPLIEAQVVQAHRWLNYQEFTDIITISQMTPGPLAVNTSTFVGIRVAGILGATVATFGCVVSGFAISLLLYRFFQKYKNADAILSVLKGLRATSTGLIASSAGTILLIAIFGSASLSGQPLNLQLPAAAIFLFTFLLLRRWRWNPMKVILLSGLLGLIVY